MIQNDSKMINYIFRFLILACYNSLMDTWLVVLLNFICPHCILFSLKLTQIKMNTEDTIASNF